LLAESQREADDGNAGVVHAFVELLGPQPHLGAAEGRRGLERWGRDRSSRYSLMTLDSGITMSPSTSVGTTARGLSLSIPLLLMFACAQIEMLAFPFEAFFGQTKPNFLGAARHIIVIKF